MACATAAFFGCPLGGSLFAIEVVSARFGGEINCFQQFTVSAILSGTVSLGVFRWMAQLPIEPIWDFTLDSGNDVFISKISSTLPIHMLYGAILGSLGALVACLYALLRGTICQCFQNHSLLKRHPGHADQRSNPLNNQSIVLRAWMGATAIILLGMTFPHTLFWGEFEFQTIATMCPATKLPHLKFAQSIVGWEMHNAPTAGLLGVAKFIAIAVAIAGGYRGGFIFPLFAAAAALGRALHFVLPIIPVQLCVLCLAAAVNVAVTRTALATTLILTYLSGEPNALSAILVASLVSLNITSLAPWVFTTASTPPPPTELVSSSDEEHVTINLCSLNKCSLTKRDFDTCNDSTTLLHDGGRFNENDDDKSGQKDELTVFLPDDDHKVIKKSTVPT